MLSSRNSDQLLQLEQQNNKLRRALDELVILNELALEIGAKFDLQEILQMVVRRSIKAANAEQGTISLVKQQQKDSHQTLVRTQQSCGHGQPFHLNQALLGWMQLNRQPLVIHDPHHDIRFQGVTWNSNIRSVICVPLLIKSELTGILTLFNKKEGDFSVEDTRLLTIVAAQSAQVIENVRLYEEEKVLVSMKKEVRLASQIQTALLPKSAPVIPGYDVAGFSKPAQVVGGDYFDFIRIDSSRWAICVGDISGKGLPAALLMANLQATIRGQCMIDPSPSICLERANKLLYQSTDPQKYATLFYCVLDFSIHRLDYANAGHNRPLLIQGDLSSIPLATGGIALSCMENAVFKQDALTLHPGDFCVLFSDGITESMDATDKEYGEQKLLECIFDNKHLTAEQLTLKIVESAEQHARGCPQWDDMTLVVIKRNLI